MARGSSPSHISSVAIKEFTASIIFVMFFVPLDIYAGCSCDWQPIVLSIFTILMVHYGTGGAACNPSVSVADWIGGSLTAMELAVSILSQLAGSVCAVPIIRLFLVADISSVAPGPVGGFGAAEAAREACLGAYLLVSMALARLFPYSTLVDLADSLMYVAFEHISCNRTGAFFNPMYAVALSVWSPGETTQWARYAAVYVVSPTLGAALATTVWAVGLKMYEEYYPYVLHILRNNSEKEKIS